MSYGGFLEWGYPNSWMVCKGKSDENGWIGGYPYFRKPPYVSKPGNLCHCLVCMNKFAIVAGMANPNKFSPIFGCASQVPTVKESMWRTCESIQGWFNISQIIIWRWNLKCGYPQIYCSRIFPYKPSSYWGTTMTMETPMWVPTKMSTAASYWRP